MTHHLWGERIIDRHDFEKSTCARGKIKTSEAADNLSVNFMSSKFAARLVRDEPAEVISNNPGWLLQVQRHEYSEFVVQPGNFVCCHRKLNPASIQIGNLAGFRKSMQNSAEAAGQREPSSQSATNRNKWQRLVTRCFEMLSNVSECSGKNDLLPRPSCHRGLQWTRW
jgi:hypothetical protein